jgi:CRISPR-associated protein Cas2
MARRRYVVAYDIRDSKRLQKVQKAMKEFGYSLQYSVFVCDLDATEKIGMKSAISALINHRQDSVAIIDLGRLGTPGVDRFEFMGQSQGLPHGGPHVL